ncbi:hypothetical protein PRIPAC_72601, partial [Pristionchus pacificus]|uniref:Uncharacterized protein n=1 Tax=Pristionchus pacificus TaxID=54126 RepID=A0A8R1Z861_PRIPA
FSSSAVDSTHCVSYQDEMSSRERSGRSRSRWNAEDDMDISNSDDERKPPLRDGVLHPHPNYYQFIIKWMAEMSAKNPSREKKMQECISQATAVERERINLPPHEKMNLVHCGITIKGLPPSVFCGSGYGSERKLAHFAAAKDLMDKCLKMGMITRDLHKVIGSRPNLDMNRRLPDYPRAMEAINFLDSRISKASWREKVDQKKKISSYDLAQLDQFIAESRESVYGVNAPVYDDAFCGVCKRKTHTDTCPYGLEEKRVAKLKRDQEEREMERERRERRGRSRSRDRGRDIMRDEKDKERMDIERKIMEQREALAREDDDRKLKEATDRARAAALAFGGGGIPMVGGPGAAPLVTPGLSGTANPIEMMMNTSSIQSNIPYGNPFHPLNHIGPSPEMVSSMAQFTSMMDPIGGGYGNSPMRKDPVTIPTGYAAHVKALEEQRARAQTEEMARRGEEMARRGMFEREKDEMGMRDTTEATLRAEMEARLHEEIEQKRREMEMELREKLAPREVRKIGGDFGDFGAAMSAYGVNMPSTTSNGYGMNMPPTTSMNINTYGGTPNTHDPMNSYSQSTSYDHHSMSSNGLSSPPNQYACVTMQSMQPLQPLQPQQPWLDSPIFKEIQQLVNDNSDLFKNLAFAPDPTLATHPVLGKLEAVGRMGGHDMELIQVREELKVFISMLKSDSGRASAMEDRGMKMERGRDDRERRDEDRRERRSRSRSFDRRDYRRDDKRVRIRGGGRDSVEGRVGWGYRRREEKMNGDDDVEVIVQVGGSRFRQLRAKEALQLKKNDIVVAQDLKNGKWSTAKVVKVSEKRVQLTVGNALWKKEFNEVYTPI